MNLRTCFAAFVIGVTFCLSSPDVFAAETNLPSAALTDVNSLVERVNARITALRTNQTVMAEKLKDVPPEFDRLLTKHSGAPERDRAQIAFMKLQFYLQVLDDQPGALEVLRQFQRDFPNIQINGNTQSLIDGLDRQIAAERIQRSLVPGARFPEFSEKDINDKSLELAKYKGKVVLIDFWATWCMPCLITLPEVTQAYEKFHAKGFEVIGVSLDEDQQALKRFIRDREIKWPQYFDGKKWENKLALQYGINSTPTTYLLDRQGRIIGKNLQGAELAQAISKALGEM